MMSRTSLHARLREAARLSKIFGNVYYDVGMIPQRRRADVGGHPREELGMGEIFQIALQL
jgi:hypothetical protein